MCVIQDRFNSSSQGKTREPADFASLADSGFINTRDWKQTLDSDKSFMTREKFPQYPTIVLARRDSSAVACECSKYTSQEHATNDTPSSEAGALTAMEPDLDLEALIKEICSSACHQPPKRRMRCPSAGSERYVRECVKSEHRKEQVKPKKRISFGRLMRGLMLSTATPRNLEPNPISRCHDTFSSIAVVDSDVSEALHTSRQVSNSPTPPFRGRLDWLTTRVLQLGRSD